MIVSVLYSVGIGGIFKKSLSSYIIFFASNFCFFLGMGSSGLWLGFEAIGRNGASGGLIFVGVLMVITGVGWGLAALADFYLLAKVRILLLHISTRLGF